MSECVLEKLVEIRLMEGGTKVTEMGCNGAKWARTIERERGREREDR